MVELNRYDSWPTFGSANSAGEDYEFWYRAERERRAQVESEVKKLKKELDSVKAEMKALKFVPNHKRILKNGDYMTVLWADGTKTIVKRAEDEAESDYAAFTAALGIKLHGSNSALKRIVSSAEIQGKRKKQKAQKGE